MKRILVVLLILGTGIPLSLLACSASNPQQPAADISDQNSSAGIFIFGSVLNDQRGIFQIDLENSMVQSFNDAAFERSCPTYSPDGSQIAFCCAENGIRRLFIMQSDGTNVHLVTNEISGCSCSPDAPLSWSPDGEWILLPGFPADANAQNFVYDIFLVSQDGSSVTNLTEDPQRYGGLLWDPDGRSIYFSGKIGDKADIYRMDIDNRKSTSLTSQPIMGEPTDWSDDGTQLLYFTDSGGGNLDIFLLRKDENQAIRLTDAEGSDSYPQWFPDNLHILFVSKRDGNEEIFTMKADGSDQKNLTNNPDQMDIWPSLSPDGKKIIYLTAYEDQWDSWVMNADGSEKTKITDLIGLPADISWKP